MKRRAGVGLDEELRALPAREPRQWHGHRIVAADLRGEFRLVREEVEQGIAGGGEEADGVFGDGRLGAQQGLVTEGRQAGLSPLGEQAIGEAFEVVREQRGEAARPESGSAR